MSSRNTQEDASRHGRMSPGQDIKYGIDESMRSIVQTAPPYPDRRSATPSSSGLQEDHIRKKARLEYESSAADITSPSIGGYDAHPGPGRGLPGYIPSNYNWQAHQSYGHYGQQQYGVPASAPPLRESHGMHMPPSSSAITESNESAYPPVAAEFPAMHQSTRSTGSVSSPGSQNYARATAQGNSGYQSYSALPHPSSNTYSTGPGSLGPPGGMALSESPQLSQHHDSRTWSHAYGVSAALSPNPNLSMPMMSRQAPIPRTAPPIEQSSAYYSRSYPPYDERSMPVGMSTSPYQQSTPQFLSPESGPSVFRGELPYPSSGSSAPRATGSTSSSGNQPGSKSQALFVSKLYNMLEDPEIVASGLLKWSADGQGFVCSDPNEFARLFLSKYFKHANWHSFVRQLNMYGFNKQVNDVFQTLSQPADQPVAWEFRHSIFRRGDPSCIQRIKRRSVKSSTTAHRDLASSQIARPAGLPSATPMNPAVYSTPYQPVTYSSDAASHSMMALPRYSGGDPYAMPGGYPSAGGGQGSSAPSHSWMSGPGPQYSTRPPPYPLNTYLPSESNPASSQRGSSTLPSRTTESYTRHDRPGRPY